MSSKDMEAWLLECDNPMKPIVTEMRALILETDPRLGECIKWQAPTFTYRGNMASFFPKSKKHASLMFHKGATIERSFPNLAVEGKEARSFKVSSLDDLEQKSAELQSICVAWCKQQDAIDS